MSALELAFLIIGAVAVSSVLVLTRGRILEVFNYRAQRRFFYGRKRNR